MAITRGIDVKLNVRPIHIGLIHEYVFEGPCRFGAGEELTQEFDEMSEAENFKEFSQNVIENLGDMDGVNVIEPLYVQRFCNFLPDYDMMATMIGNEEDVDVYMVSLEIARGDLVLELAQRSGKPVMIVPGNCCMITETVANLTAQGYEGYGYFDWNDCRSHIKAMRIKKVLQNTNVLLAPRMNSNNSLASDATFLSLVDVTNKLGTRFRYISAHELLDQLHEVDPSTNHTTPGRKVHNINKEDMKIVNKITDDLVDGAQYCAMDRDKLATSVKGYVLVQKLLQAYECNAFSMPCPDICATRRLNEEGITFCLTHSLNNEQGIPSACEYDVNSLLSMQVLANLSGSAPYMGNTNPLLYEDGIAQPRRVVSEEDLRDIKNVQDLYFLFHSTPNRKLKGFNEPAANYGINSFATSGFGGTIRYDFAKDSGQVITMMRFSPDLKKIFISKGTIKGGGGYDQTNCTLSVIFQVEDQRDYFNKQVMFGNHIQLVYGDYTNELMKFAEIMGMEPVIA